MHIWLDEDVKYLNCKYVHNEDLFMNLNSQNFTSYNDIIVYVEQKYLSGSLENMIH